MSRKTFFASLFVLGITSIMGQVIVLRELTINFYGNEFFIGMTLAFWLAWVAAGSVLPRLGTLHRRIVNKNALAVIQFLAIAIVFLEIFFIRYAKGMVGFPGEIPNLVVAFSMAILIPLPLCVVLGLWWTSASGLLAKNIREVAFDVNRGYLVETIGFIVGGVLFSMVLVTFPSFVIAQILALLVLALLLLWIGKRTWMRFPLLAILGAAVWLTFPAVMDLENATTALRFKNQIVIETVGSPFGQLTVTQIGDQKNFYESGLLLGSDREEFAAEELVHIPMLEHPRPDTVLLLGGGFSGALNEILKHGAKDIYYLELDPTLIALAGKYLPALLKNNLVDQRVHLLYDDGYHFLKNTDKRFDIIIVNLPAPSTALINRFYTEEFFALANSRMNDGGVFSTHLPFAPDQPTRALVRLNASVVGALGDAFGQVLALPEESNFLLASDGDGLTLDPEVLKGRFRERGLENKFITENYIDYRLTTDRIAQAKELFEDVKDTEANREFRPIAYFYQTLFWLDRFYPRLSRAIAFLSKAFWPIALVALVLLALVARGRDRPTLMPVISVATAGFSLMASEIVVIFVYQTVVGFLYYRLALLIAALMAGMALGVWIGNRWISKRGVTERSLIKLHLLLIAFCAFLFASTTMIGSLSMGLAEVALLVLAELAGFFGALVYPIANRLYLDSHDDPEGRTGIIYGADLAGSALGAVLPSIVLIPLFGVWQTLLFVGIVNVWAIINLRHRTS